MSPELRACAVVPTFENPITVRTVVERIRAHGIDVVLVDDGSGPPGRAACDEVAAAKLATLVRLETNQGKGSAVMAGFQVASELGYTHAFQIDADAQHDLDSIPTFLEASRSQPDALVLGFPIYDETVPSSRRIGRKFTAMWVALEVGSRTKIQDAMIGFRVYPLASTLAIKSMGRGMDFDIEVAVRMVRAGVPTVNLPVRVFYHSAEDGGVSHFHVVKDNLSFSFLHARLCTAGLFGWIWKSLFGRTAHGQSK